jgi:hypothetical protein
MRDHCSLVAQATIFTTRARDIAPEGSVRFSNKIVSAGSAFTPNQSSPLRESALRC